ncbi:MAG TPA: hypothetical protein VHO90_16165, partial [Bacteroidales bacterium]|nr:hypothetical protein [Bacteroidales bacterium]
MKKKSGFSALATLMAALTVSENFTLNSAALIAEQPQWADPYNSNFKKIIEKFLAEYFGITSRNQLKEATRLVTSLQAEAKEDLGLIKTQIVRNFRKAPDRKASLLDLLGYSAHWKKASNSNQGELIALLFA